MGKLNGKIHNESERERESERARESERKREQERGVCLLTLAAEQEVAHVLAEGSTDVPTVIREVT